MPAVSPGDTQEFAIARGERVPLRAELRWLWPFAAAVVVVVVAVADGRLETRLFLSVG